MLLAVVLATWPSVAFLAGKWRIESENLLAHGWILIALAFWDIYRSRPPQVGAAQVSADAGVGTTAVAVALCMVAGLVWAVFFAANIASLAAALALAMFVLGVWAIYGRPAIYQYAGALFLLTLALPFWDIFLQPLWLASIFVCTNVVRLLGTTVLVEGNVVRLESGEIVIAAGCAGISFFVTSIALAAVLGQLGKVTAKTQVVMILVAGLGAMVFNWLRIIALILIGIYSHMQSPLMADHGAFGWSLFAVWIFAFVLWSTNFGATRIEGRSVRHQFANPPLRPTLLPAAALMIVPLWVQIAPAFAVDREARAMDGSGPLLGVAWAPVFENADAVSLRAIPDGDARLWVFEASYTAQRQGKELFGPNNSILGDLALLESQRAANHSFEDLWARDGQGGYWQLRYAYLVGDAASADRWRTTLALVKRRFRGRSDARVIAIARACEEAGCDAHDKASIDVTWSKLSTAAKP